VASGTALAALEGVVRTALVRDRGLPDTAQAPAAFEIRQHRRYNPAAVTSLNIVPGLLGTILTMTMLIFTALSVTRELERGTMESLLAMPIEPLEIMIGKIAPYIVIGFIQAALIVGFGVWLFEVPIVGSIWLLAGLSTLFIAANLSIGYTFSTVAQNQLQAIQMSFMFFLPNILLSGFMFPFAGMPGWAQAIGEALPLTLHPHRARHHASGRNLYDLQIEALALVGLMLFARPWPVRCFRDAGLTRLRSPALKAAACAGPCWRCDAPQPFTANPRKFMIMQNREMVFHIFDFGIPIGSIWLEEIRPRPAPERAKKMKMNDRANGFLWGLAVAAVVVPIGLSKGFGWYTGGQAGTFARHEANLAVVKALLPICVANFQKTPDSPAKLAELKNISSPWARETFVRENKWAVIGAEQDTGVIDACAAALA
jgi:ABC-type multidrug transport system permease subunit